MSQICKNCQANNSDEACYCANCGNSLNEFEQSQGKTEEELIKLANQGDMQAQADLGDIYLNKEHYTEAFKWYRKAAEQGHTLAQQNLVRIQEELNEHENEVNENQQQVKKSNKNSGCFIVTAVYNSPTAPKVMILREFRDQKLLTTSLGKSFVKFYYKYSPPIANLLSKHKLLPRNC
ncbi:zinc ribbon domain-containing protein [Candidatus Marithrix sp. Canyon 246]|uniref:zinc ribbon domain-containing protein n=1 Tax=Candidatus Marithrix sp. Canyon 246 TaxID=1827136 RepID=UPI00084A1E3D|nr:zinc ribbon domain-containing protein [Candidatus Marithrix sp. Canyon 246]